MVKCFKCSFFSYFRDFLGKQSLSQTIREELCFFLGFGEGFRACWAYFGGFLGLLPLLYAIFCI